MVSNSRDKPHQTTYYVPRLKPISVLYEQRKINILKHSNFNMIFDFSVFSRLEEKSNDFTEVDFILRKTQLNTTQAGPGRTE